MRETRCIVAPIGTPTTFYSGPVLKCPMPPPALSAAAAAHVGEKRSTPGVHATCLPFVMRCSVPHTPGRLCCPSDTQWALQPLRCVRRFLFGPRGANNNSSLTAAASRSCSSLRSIAGPANDTRIAPSAEVPAGCAVLLLAHPRPLYPPRRP